MLVERGAWVAQSVKRLTFHFGSEGHDLVVHEFEPHIGLCADSAWSLHGILSLSLSLCPFSSLSLSFSLSLKINKYTSKEINVGREIAKLAFREGAPPDTLREKACSLSSWT